MWKLVLVVMVVAALVAQCGNAQSSPMGPDSRTAPYSVTITAGKNAIPVAVIKMQNYIVALEGNPCSIAIRHLFTNQVAHLLWTANYDV